MKPAIAFNFVLRLFICRLSICYCETLLDRLMRKNVAGNRTNILFILADDLGYGDLSVDPFVGAGVHTPELEKMAQRGTVMTNFHTAAATCTPTRASVLTGMYPWRLGIKAVYEYGEKAPGKSNRDDWLPQVLTSAMVFRDSNYFTGHSGKWHLGGMRNDDLDMRLLPVIGGTEGNQKCQHPGPNQQGFEEYVSVLDGPGAPRQNELQIDSTLHSRGCDHLLRNDVHIGRDGGEPNEFLSDCEARHAVRMMKMSVKEGKPFYIHLWFHAPHGPWEVLPGFESVYPGLRGGSRNNMDKYKTMITAMDRSIGNVLTAVRSLGVEKNTLVVFTSDNGPEDFYGTTAGHRGNKRFLYEGGIRVPSIWQWVGTIPKGRKVHSFGVTTDLLPTFLHAAGLGTPTNALLDGTSLLPDLIPSMKNRKASRKSNADRITMWHGDFEGPRSSAAWILDFKLMFNQSDFPTELYDMKFDPLEKNNLLIPFVNNSLLEMVNFKLPTGSFDLSIFGSNRSLSTHEMRNNSGLHRLIVSRVYKTLNNFVQYGNEAHLIYLEKNSGRVYKPTVESDIRHSRHNVYKHITKKESAKHKEGLLASQCTTPCRCEVPRGTTLPPFPFQYTKNLSKTAQPGLVPPAHVMLMNELL